MNVWDKATRRAKHRAEVVYVFHYGDHVEFIGDVALEDMFAAGDLTGSEYDRDCLGYAEPRGDVVKFAIEA